MVALTKLALSGLVCSCVQALSLNVPLQQDISDAMAVFGFEQPTVQRPFEMSGIGLPDDNLKPVPGDSPIQQCDVYAPQILSLKKVTVDPNPPLKGANLTFVAEGVLSADVEDGAYVEVDVRYGYIRLIHQTFDLCEEITKVDLECPILKGKQVIEKTVEIPKEVPPGKYIVYARAFTKDDEFITCLTTTIVFPAT